MQNTRLIFIPSINGFLRFREFRNDHLYAMFRTNDSLVDSLYTQRDIIEECLCDDHDINSLTILDCFAIFLTWRINCIDNELVFDHGTGFPNTIDISEWLVKISKLADEDFKYEFESNGITFTCGLPNISDITEVYRFHMLDRGDVVYKNTLTHNELNTLCLITHVNGQRISFKDKEELFSLLPPQVARDINKFATRVHDIVKTTDIKINFGIGEKYELSLDLIPTLNKFLCSGSPTHLLENSVYLSKKCGVSFTDYLKMSPMESIHLINYMQDIEKPDDGSGDEQIDF